MHKRKLHHLLVKIRPISYWYFVAIFVISLGVALVALRQNNIKALELRDKVLEVDKANGDVESALRELREFTYSHMNARLSSDTGIYPPIQLKYRYERLVAEEKKRVEGSSDDIYNDAQKYCEATQPQGLYGASRLGCIQNYIDRNGGTERPEPRPIPDAMYKFDFVSPLWSPDLAGWALVVALVSLVLLITRLAAGAWLKHQTS